ncbi:transglycosylase domain-containing protein, partial [Candidatus Saccharibacteria bacterium]|nr:transglycosylase domain-containing protein [Candidatus Saccharibacteria bacterium]
MNKKKSKMNLYSSLTYRGKASGERKAREKASTLRGKSVTSSSGGRKISKKVELKTNTKNLTHREKAKLKADERARAKAEDLASLPKNPVKRFFAKLHPKRLAKFWFSKDGLKMFGKIVAATILIAIIAVGGLFLYYKKDLDQIKLDEMKVSETVNTYYDRNGQLLWEDKGDGDYRLVVEGDQISTYMRQATVAIEDRNFYNHPGVDWTALIRAGLSTVSGQGVQGGSTLTQQLIKQVYFSDEASDRTVTGLPRKIKEVILALEVEKMYDKEQIITMYLNESPYGGRRNGVESAAKTYFGKNAKDLTLAESALIASIPNNPGVLNPYNEYGNEALIARQHKTLDVMAEMGYITKD